MEIEDIKKEIHFMASRHNYTVNNNVDKIINAKIRFFGEDSWERCPCDSSNESRCCISAQCHEDIKKDGNCHCNVFLLKRE